MRQEVLFLHVLMYSCLQAVNYRSYSLGSYMFGDYLICREKEWVDTQETGLSSFGWGVGVYRDRSREYFFLYHILIFEPYKFVLIHKKKKIIYLTSAHPRPPPNSSV